MEYVLRDNRRCARVSVAVHASRRARPPSPRARRKNNLIASRRCLGTAARDSSSSSVPARPSLPASAEATRPCSRRRTSRSRRRRYADRRTSRPARRPRRAAANPPTNPRRLGTHATAVRVPPKTTIPPPSRRQQRRVRTRDDGVARTRGEARSPSGCDAAITWCGARREAVENEDATRRTTAYRRARRLGKISTLHQRDGK